MAMYDPPYHQPRRDEMCQRLISELGQTTAFMLALIFDCRPVFEKATFNDVQAFLSSLPNTHYKLAPAIEWYLSPLCNTEESEQALFSLCTEAVCKKAEVFSETISIPQESVQAYAWPVAKEVVDRLAKRMKDRAASFHEYQTFFYSGIFKHLKISQVRFLYPNFFRAMLSAVASEEELDGILSDCQSDEDIVFVLHGWYRAEFAVPYARKAEHKTNSEYEEIKERFGDSRQQGENNMLHEAEEKKRVELLEVLMSARDFETMYHAMLKFLFLNKEVRIEEYLLKKD